MKAEDQVWDPVVLARIGKLELIARQATLGMKTGSHKSLRIASNVEFADYKEYTPGDNLRDLDWRVCARNDRLVVRRHQAETELRVVVVLDASADLGTGQGGQVQRPPLVGTKFGYAVTLAATLAYFAVKRGDPVGLFISGGADVPFPVIPPRGGSGHLAQMMGTLASVRPSGTAGLASLFEEVGRRIQRRSLVLLVSDFMEEPKEWGETLGALARAGADVRGVHLFDEREYTLDYPDAARFYSPEGGPMLPLDPPAVKNVFSQVVEEYLGEVRAHFARHGAVHHLVSTSVPLSESLFQVVGGL